MNLKISALTKKFGPRVLFENVTIAFEGDTVYGVTGDNGTGKSTFLNCVAGLCSYHGHISLDGVVVPSNSPARAIRMGFAYMKQSPALLFSESVYNNLKLAAELTLAKKLRQSRVEEAIEKFDLVRMLKNTASTLSGGEQKRLDYAIIWLGEANHRVYLLDEPFAGADSGWRETLVNEISRHRASGKVVLIVSHEKELLSTISDASLLFSNGKISFI